VSCSRAEQAFAIALRTFALGLREKLLCACTQRVRTMEEEEEAVEEVEAKEEEEACKGTGVQRLWLLPWRLR